MVVASILSPMFEDEPDEPKSEVAGNPAERAKEKSDEFRMHAEFAAVFEGRRKFDATIRPTLDATLAREIQRTIGKLEKSKSPESPILPPASVEEAAALLDLPATMDLPTNDYLVSRRPGETMIVRWLAGDEVDAYYARMQAHFDAAIEGFKEDERQGNAWRQDAKSQAFLTALDAIEVKMADRYLRDLIREHSLFVLSTQTADEVNIAYLAGDVMGVAPADVVGAANAPPDDAPSDRDLAWFFKLFSLRGVKDGVEQMCFFTFLQKSDDDSF